MGHDLEASATPAGQWMVTRFRGRAWIQAGRHLDVIAQLDRPRDGRRVRQLFPAPGRRREGVTLNPSVEFRLPGGRGRAEYQFFTFRTTDLSTVTRGGDLVLTLPISARATWTVQVTARTGTTARTASGYTSVELRV